MSKKHNRSNREARKPKKSAAERTAEATKPAANGPASLAVASKKAR